MSGIINFAQPVVSSFLVDVIFWLVSITSSVAVGVVLFTLILKLITLPFDYISRASMRKNTVIMEEMRPELEKLQRQYADNKDLYNQKMMALYKKNGYSMLSSCLPTIITLIIFIVAINAFTSYSQWQNRQYFYDMSLAYNSVLYDGIKADGEYIIENEDGSITINDNIIYTDITKNPDKLEDKGIIAKERVDGETKFLDVYTKDGYIKYIHILGHEIVDGKPHIVYERKYQGKINNVDTIKTSTDLLDLMFINVEEITRDEYDNIIITKVNKNAELS
jgi:YidC/Oxa1 family membrane protein insertase